MIGQSRDFAMLKSSHIFLKPSTEFRAKDRANSAVLNSYRSQVSKLQHCLFNLTGQLIIASDKELFSL